MGDQQKKSKEQNPSPKVVKRQSQQSPRANQFQGRQPMTPKPQNGRARPA